MSIEVRFYTGYSKKINSTKQPAITDTFTKFDCTLKEGCNILNPEIEVYLSPGDPSGFNYAHIPSFGRYYFVSDWTYFHGTWTASLSVDVLASYKTEIGNLTRYVLRSYSSFDQKIIDNQMTMLPALKKISPYKVNNALASPFSASGTGGGGTGGLYIVAIQGPQPTNIVPSIGGVCYYPMSYDQMKQLLDYLTSSTFANLQKDDAVGLSAEVVRMMQDPSQYIVSCMWYPWTMTTSGAVQPKIGFWNTSPLTDPTVGLGNSGFTSLSVSLSFGHGIDIPSHPQEASADYGLYLRAAPYSLYKFHLEPWGDIDIDGSKIVDCERISGSIQVDYVTGQAALNLFAIRDTSPAKTIPIGRYFAQVGVPVGIAQLIYQMQNVGGAVVPAAASTVSGIAQTWKSSTYEGINKVDSFLGRINTFLGNMFSKDENVGLSKITQDAISSGMAYMAEPSRSGINGGYLSYYGVTGSDAEGNQYFVQGPYLEVTQFKAVEPNNVEQGRPLMKSVQLNTLSGFIMCAESDIDLPGMTSEKAAIGRYLTGGFFYE